MADYSKSSDKIYPLYYPDNTYQGQDLSPRPLWYTKSLLCHKRPLIQEHCKRYCRFMNPHISIETSNTDNKSDIY